MRLAADHPALRPSNYWHAHPQRFAAGQPAGEGKRVKGNVEVGVLGIAADHRVVGQLVQQFVVQAACGAMLTGIAGQVGQIHLGTQIVRGKGLRPLVAAPGGLAIGVHLRQRRWSKLLPLAAACPLKKVRHTQRWTTWYQGVPASELREERGRVMGRSLKNAVYLGN